MKFHNFNMSNCQNAKLQNFKKKKSEAQVKITKTIKHIFKISNLQNFRISEKKRKQY